MTRNITIRDIARKAGVSHTTVSRALADSTLVKEPTKAHIRELADRMGYVPNAMAKGLATDSTNTIGMVIPDIMNPYYSEVAKGLKDFASKEGFSILFCDTDKSIGEERAYIEQLCSQRVSGIIIAPVSQDLDHIFKYYSPQGPLVFLSYQPELEGCSFVETDPFQIGYLGTRYLLQLGHRSIAFIGHEENRQTTTKRFSGYRAAHAEFGVPMFSSDSAARFDVRTRIGYTLTRDLLIQGRTPTGIMAYNDMIAIEAMEAVEEFGLRVPDDISVVGIDNVFLANLYRIHLTTVHQPKYQIGEWCARILIDKIRNPKNREGVRKVLEPELVIRTSCRAASQHRPKAGRE